MSGKRKPRRTSGVDQGQHERVDDPRVALERTKDVLRRILKVPKAAIANRDDRPRSHDPDGSRA